MKKVEDTLRTIAESLERLHRRLDQGDLMATALESLAAQVQANTDVTASAVQLLRGLHDQLVAAGTDAAALASLAANLKASTDSLATAVAANTPAAPTPAPDPAPAA